MKQWRRYLRIAVALMCLSAAVIAFCPAAYAYIDQPDAAPSVSFLHVNRNLLTTGDAAVTGAYNIPYTDYPETIASRNFYIRLVSANGTEDIGTVTPFTYFNRGYGHGAFMIYIASGYEWEANYIVRISENPSQFEAPVNFDFILNAADYFTASETSSDNQADLDSQVIKLATDLQSHYTSYTFIQTIPGRTVLAAPTGETYFSNAMPGLQSMAPGIFLIQLVYPDTTSSNWTTTQSDNYTARFSGGWTGAATNATASQFHVTPQMVTGLVFTLPICIGAIILSSRKFLKAEPGFIVCLIALIMSFILGWVPAAVFASFYQALGIYVAYLLVGARSS
ncbi:MAG: hypothetical protein PHG35_01995 [Dehalococcoidales bacterium]|nr:hypothetical protein [Dehalococcoidales bacterium]